MAQYHNELNKWMKITLDKLFLEQSFADSTSRLSAEELYPLIRWPGELSETEFFHWIKRPRADARRLLNSYLRSGLLEKQRDRADARKRILCLSKAGADLSQAMSERLEQGIEFLLEGMTVNEEIAVLKFISKINQLTVGKYDPEK